MKKGKIRKQILLFLLAMGLCLTAVQPVSAAKSNTQRQTVRVGITRAEGADITEEESPMETYEKEYLQAVAEYADWDYEYVNTTWADCLI